LPYFFDARGPEADQFVDSGFQPGSAAVTGICIADPTLTGFSPEFDDNKPALRYGPGGERAGRDSGMRIAVVRTSAISIRSAFHTVRGPSSPPQFA
jgi:hypothetical protein